MATIDNQPCPICTETMQEISNQFCEMHASLLYPSQTPHQYLCPSCGHGQLQHAIPPEILYNSSVAIPTDHSAGDIRFAFIQGATDVAQIDGAIVEFGGGPGELAEQARLAIGHPRATVMDFVDRLGFDTLDFVQMDLNADSVRIPLLLQQNKQDKNLFLLSHVVEHLSDPYQLLEQLHGFENSLVYIEVPDFGSRHAASTLKFSLNCLEHYHYFTDRSLLAMVQNAGFQVLAFDTQRAPRMPAIRVLCTPRSTQANAVQDYEAHFDLIAGRLQQKILGASARQDIWIWGLSAFMAKALQNLGTQRSRIRGIFDTRYPQASYLGIEVEREPRSLSDGQTSENMLLICGSTYSAVQNVIRAKASKTFPHAEFFTVSTD